MKYEVIRRFKDLQDNNRVYEVGEEYKGKKTKSRIEELSSSRNKIGEPLIKKVE